LLEITEYSVFFCQNYLELIEIQASILSAPIIRKELRKLFYDAGYELIPRLGKRSHWKLKKIGFPTVIVPNHKVLKKGDRTCPSENARRIKIRYNS